MMDAVGASSGANPNALVEPNHSTPGVVPLIPITDAMSCMDSQMRSHPSFRVHRHSHTQRAWRRNSLSLRSLTSSVSSLNGTVRSGCVSSTQSMLGTVLEVPPGMLLHREQLRLRRSAVLGKGAYGLVVCGELYPVSATPRGVTPVGMSGAGSSASLRPLPHSASSSGDDSLLAAKHDGAGHPLGIDTAPTDARRRGGDLCASFLHAIASASEDRPREANPRGLFELLHDARSPPATPSPPTTCLDDEARSSPGAPRPVAVKLINKARLSRRLPFIASFQTELRLAAALAHPSLVAVHGVVEEATELLLVMDVAEGGSLQHHMRTHGLEDMRATAPRFLADVVLGLEYLAAAGIAHRDIKPDNMLLTADYHVLLADFGTACYVASAEENRFGGTAAYMSPEMVRDGRASATSDLWSLGCVLFELFVGRPPFQGETNMFVMRHIKQYESGTLEYPPYFPSVARDLVERLLRRDPNARLGAKDAGGFDALKAHPFFAGIAWDTVQQTSNRTPNHTDYAAQVRPYLGEEEHVVRCSLVVKESPGFLKLARQRLLVLTNTPRLFYMDPTAPTAAVKGEIPLSSALYAEVHSTERFRVVLPKAAGGRVYEFHDPNGHADVWGMRINDCVKRVRVDGPRRGSHGESNPKEETDKTRDAHTTGVSHVESGKRQDKRPHAQPRPLPMQMPQWQQRYPHEESKGTDGGHAEREGWNANSEVIAKVCSDSTSRLAQSTPNGWKAMGIGHLFGAKTKPKINKGAET